MPGSSGRTDALVFADRLSGTVKQTVVIPENAIADSSKLMVKVYPGVISQVMELYFGLIRAELLEAQRLLDAELEQFLV